MYNENETYIRGVEFLKFSEIEENKWAELKPYLDTVLLPITGLTGAESPAEATKKLEKLRDIMDMVEIPFAGRVVTYPALHYIGSDKLEMSKHMNEVCQRLKQQGFVHIILITASKEADLQAELADVWIMPEEDGTFPTQEKVSKEIMNIWKR